MQVGLSSMSPLPYQGRERGGGRYPQCGQKGREKSPISGDRGIGIIGFRIFIFLVLGIDCYWSYYVNHYTGLVLNIMCQKVRNSQYSDEPFFNIHVLVGCFRYPMVSRYLLYSYSPNE